MHFFQAGRRVAVVAGLVAMLAAGAALAQSAPGATAGSSLSPTEQLLVDPFVFDVGGFIVSSNIDEFFQKRIGGLKQQVGAQLHSITPDGRTPQQQIDDCLLLITRLETRKIAMQSFLQYISTATGVTIGG